MSTQMVWPLQHDAGTGGAIDEQQTLSSLGAEEIHFAQR